MSTEGIGSKGKFFSQTKSHREQSSRGPALKRSRRFNDEFAL